MKKRFLFFLLFLCSLNGYGQVGMGEWRIFPSPYTVQDVVVANGEIFGLLGKGLIEYDPDIGQITLWTVADYLSDIHPTAIAFNKSTKTIIVGYQNGNVDFIKNNRVTNFPAILNSNTNDSKTINSITTQGNYAYLATGTGIVVIDLKKREVKDTYHPSKTAMEFIDVAFTKDSIYAVTDSLIFVSNSDNNFLASFHQWDTLHLSPKLYGGGHYFGIESFNNNVFIPVKYDTVSNGDTLFQIYNGQITVFDAPITFAGMRVQDDQLLVSTEGYLKCYNSSFSKVKSFHYYSGTWELQPNNGCFIGDTYYIADQRSGLMRIDPSGSGHFITFGGPRYTSAFRAKWRNGVLSIACGGLSGAYIPTYSKDGAVIKKGEEWQSMPVYGFNILNNKGAWDFISTAINPNLPDEVAYGTYSSVPLVITKEGKGVSYYDSTNSILEMNSAETSMISDMCYDDEGNLWVANSKTQYPLKVLTKEGQWYQFNLGTVVSGRETTRLIIDNNGVKWLAITGVGLIAFDEGESIADKSDDKFKVFTTAKNHGNLPSDQVQGLAADIDNNIWVGTQQGMRVLFNTDNILDAGPGQYDFQKLLIQYGPYVEIVLGYTNITSIEVDGGGRKWIGTESAGVFLLSPDGLSVKKKFTSDNSPLLDNSILDIAINRTNGIVYFLTNKGMIAYRSDASQGDQEYSNVIVFPNPVRPEYRGPIAIQGIAYNSDVRITDVSGRLVYHTKSHGGTATWNGQTVNGKRATTGVYLIWTSIDSHDFKGKKVGKVVFIR